MKQLNWILTLTLPLVVSCSVEERDIPTLEVGQEFTDKTVRLIEIDTFEVRTSTFKLDSMITSQGKRLLIGRYLDNYFGTVKSESYLELTAEDYRVPEDAELDSIALILGYDGYYYNDTLQLSHIQVHELLEEFKPAEDNFYNTSVLDFDTIPMVTKRFYPEPLGGDSLHVSVPKSFGEHVFELLKENSISGDNDFTEQFKGIVLRPSTDASSSVIGFTNDPEKTYLRFFYSIPEEFDDGDEDDGNELVLDLTTTPSYDLGWFNRITGDVTGLPLETLGDQEFELSSMNGGGLTFMQSGTGFVTKVQFPTIKNIGDLPGTGTILSAVLEMTPLVDNEDILPLKNSLQVQMVDQNNEFSSFLMNGNGIIYGRFGETDLEFSESIYQISVTGYIEQELIEAPEIDNGLILMPNDFQSAIDRVVLYGSAHKDYAPKLIITYAIYDE